MTLTSAPVSTRYRCPVRQRGVGDRWRREGVAVQTVLRRGRRQWPLLRGLWDGLRSPSSSEVMLFGQCRTFDQLLPKTVVQSSHGRVQDCIAHCALQCRTGSERGDDVVEFVF